jgi:CheY-like chemotaxis protein
LNYGKKHIDVLIIEDNLADFKLAELLLKESSVPSFGIRHAVRLEEALKMLDAEHFDIILLDLGLPDSSGLDGLKKIADRPDSLPVVVLTGLEDEEMGLEALKKQASDFLVKGRLTLYGLIRSLLYALERKRAEEILKRDKETFERLVQERTSELVKAQMELEKVKRLSDIGALATSVAHELRNPLAAIGIAVHNIRKIAITPDTDKPLGHIDKMLVGSDQIINNLLSYSRIRPPHYEKVNMIDILEESVALIEDM